MGCDLGYDREALAFLGVRGHAFLENFEKRDCQLRPAGGVKHSDWDLVETRMLSPKKALR